MPPTETTMITKVRLWLEKPDGCYVQATRIDSDDVPSPEWEPIEVASHEPRAAVQAKITGHIGLRDYFAAKAMHGLIAANGEIGPFVAADAYAMADAMLAERAKPGVPT